MHTGSLPRSIARSLPAGTVEPTHAPDGLDEPAIDALIKQTFSEVSDAPLMPSSWSADARQAVRSLPAALASTTAPATSEQEAA